MFTKLLKPTLALLGSAAMFLGATNASGAIIITDNSTAVDIPAVATEQTTGADMSGMTIKAVFADGFMEQLAWGTTGADSGAVMGSGWSITESGNTFDDSAWSFSNQRGSVLTDLYFDGAPGLTLFDTTFNFSFGTDGSFNGKDFNSALADDALVVATYSNVVGVNGAPAVGDLFHNLHVSFADVAGGGAGSFRFSQDTDNDARRDIPAPATLALFGLGLLGLGWNRRKA